MRIVLLIRPVQFIHRHRRVQQVPQFQTTTTDICNVTCRRIHSSITIILTVLKVVMIRILVIVVVILTALIAMLVITSGEQKNIVYFIIIVQIYIYFGLNIE